MTTTTNTSLEVELRRHVEGDWALYALDEPPTEQNNCGLIVYGCPSEADALAYAAEHGWVVILPAVDGRLYTGPTNQPNQQPKESQQ